MKSKLEQELIDLKKYIEVISPEHIYIQSIKKGIDEMISCFQNREIDNKKLSELAAGLYRTITDDMPYFNSDLGERIFAVIRDCPN